MVHNIIKNKTHIIGYGAMAIARFDGQSWPARVAFFLGAVGTYVLAFSLLYRMIGPVVGALATLPVFMMSAFLGLRAGLLTSLLGLPLNAALYYLVGLRGWDVVIKPQVAAAMLTLVLIGAGIRLLSDLSERLQWGLAERKQADLPDQRGEVNRMRLENVERKQLNLQQTVETLEKAVEDRTRDLFVALEELRLSNSQLQDLQNIIRSMLGSLLVVSPDGNIQTANAATCTLLGYEEKELVGQPVEKIFAQELSLNGSWFGDLVEKGFVRSVEKTYLSKDCREIPVLFSGAVIGTDKGKMQGVVCVAQDITERKRLERMKSDLITNVSNELCTPLASITGYTEVLLDKAPGELTTVQEEFLQTVYESSRRLWRLINDLLDVSQMEAGRFHRQFTPDATGLTTYPPT